MQANRKVIIIRRRRERARRSQPRILPFLARLFVLAIVLVGAVIAAFTLSGVGTALAVYNGVAQELPDPHMIETEQVAFETTKIYDRTGQVLLYELFDPRLGDRTYVSLDQIPEICRQATIVLEDKTFYDNPGFDPQGIARAAWSNLRGGPIQGGSSITQQLIKNIIIDPTERYELSYTRKMKEVLLAIEITRRYDKDQILEWYFNSNHYGSLAYGIEAASRVYFQKPVSELGLAECAILAPIPQFPLLNPLDSPEEAKARQRLVLDRLVQEGVIIPQEAEAAFAQELKIQPAQTRFDIIAPHFSLYVRRLLEEKFGYELVYRGGLKVYTTLDLELFEKAQQSVREHLAELREEDANANNAAVVAVRPNTGEILAMVGSLDYWNEEIDGNINMAISPRQPGSSFKPFTYVTAFAQGFTAATMTMDVRQSFPDPPNPPYVPENYDRKYHGPQRLRLALQRSYNIPAVWLMHQVGVRNVINTAHRMGISTLNQDYYGLSLTLGGGDVTVVDMTYAFSVFSNLGVMAGEPIPPERQRAGYRTLDPVAILRVDDSQGNTLYSYTHPATDQILDPALAYLMVNVMSDNQARAAAFGVNNKLRLEDRPAAAKTGTTDDYRDAWCIGFTPQLSVGVWVGNANYEKMNEIPGARVAAPIWNEIMTWYHRDLPVETWTRPPGLVDVRVDAVSGLLPTEHSPQVVTEIFLEGTEPQSYDNIHQVFRINRENGKLATVFTPPELVEERVYQVFPPIARDWVIASEIPQPPTEYDDTGGPAGDVGPAVIHKPRPYEYVKGGVVIEGAARTDDFALYRLEYGMGLNPTAWHQLGGDHPTPVENGPLEFWDVNDLEEGLYTLQLTVVRHDQSFERTAVQVTVDNTPPRVTVLNPTPDKTYVSAANQWVNIQVDAVDNFSMNKVEYYINGEKIGESTVAPYSYRWNLPRGYDGTVKLHVIAYDSAGNTTESEPFEFRVVAEGASETQ